MVDRSLGCWVTFPGEARVGMTVCLLDEGVLPLFARAPFVGEVITVRDKKGRIFRGRITELAADQASIFLFEEMRGVVEPPFDLALFQALPAKERMELIIQKVTELGAVGVVPFKSARSISLQEREARQPKAHRWQQIALRAAKQCRRGIVPIIYPYCSFDQALDQARPFALKIILCEDEGRKLASLMRGRAAPTSCALMVGPEGGWAAEEIEAAIKVGFTPVRLGGRIMRTETAAIAACAIIQYEWGGI